MWNGAAFYSIWFKTVKIFCVCCVSVHACGGQRCLSLLLLAFETKSVIDPGAHWPSSLVKLVSSRDMPVSDFLSLKLQVHATMLSFSCGCWGFDFRSLWLYNKHFTSRATSSPLKQLYWKQLSKQNPSSSRGEPEVHICVHGILFSNYSLKHQL